MTEPLAQLDDLIEGLEHDLEVTTERLRLARELRATFTDEPPAADPEPTPASPKKKPAAKKPKTDGVPCTECDAVPATELGMKTHRGHKHPGWDTKPVEAMPTPEPLANDGQDSAERDAGGREKLADIDDDQDDDQEPSGPDIAATGRMFCCSQCEARTHTRSGLAKHTDSAHRRGLKGDEHFAKAV